MTGPLTGLRVLDSTNERGELCGRLLADMGADVILIEPPDGSDLRDRHPRSPDGRHSLGFAWRNANKRGITLELALEEDRATFDDLVAAADVWIESSRPGSTSDPDPARIAAAHPDLIVCSISPFGHTGPYRDLHANDDVLEAFGGFMFKAGLSDKDPLLPPTTMATDTAAVVAALATVLAVHQRAMTGRGQHIDLAIMTAAGAATDWSYANASISRMQGSVYNEVRNGGGFMYPIFRCLDGHIRMVILSPRQWTALYEWMGEPEAFSDHEFWSNVGNRIMNADVLNPQYSEFFADKRMLDICTEGQHRGIVCTPLLTPGEVLADPHFIARGTFAPAEVAPGLMSVIPSGLFEIDGERHGFTHRAPAPGEHAGATFRTDPLPRPEPADAAEPTAPLAGLRVLDFGIGGVGVETSRLLGEYGADVIRVESRTYPDFIRLVSFSEVSASFVSSSRSKRSLGVNLKTEEGLGLVKALIGEADVLVENSATGTLADLGLGYDAVSELNPTMVMVSSQLVGSRGPNAHWTGYGPTTQTYGGLLYLWDYDDDDPPATNQTIYPDHLVGRLGAFAAVCGLIGRLRTGRGCHVETAQVEAVVTMLSERLLQEALTPGSAQPTGNRSPEFCPRGPYPCDGEQQWVVISVRDDAQWRALVGVLGSPSWATEPALATAVGRIEAREAIDAELRAWTATRSRADVVATLQAAGVPCGAMLNGNDMLDDPHLAARDWTIEIDQPGLGPIGLEGPAWVAPEMVGPITFPAPGLGQHTREIARELLGLSDADVDRLVADGVLELDTSTVPE